jgi:hypothetical protein
MSVYFKVYSTYKPEYIYNIYIMYVCVCVCVCVGKYADWVTVYQFREIRQVFLNWLFSLNLR